MNKTRKFGGKTFRLLNMRTSKSRLGVAKYTDSGYRHFRKVYSKKLELWQLYGRK